MLTTSCQVLGVQANVTLFWPYSQVLLPLSAALPSAAAAPQPANNHWQSVTINRHLGC